MIGFKNERVGGEYENQMELGSMATMLHRGIWMSAIAAATETQNQVGYVALMMPGKKKTHKTQKVHFAIRYLTCMN